MKRLRLLREEPTTWDKHRDSILRAYGTEAIARTEEVHELKKALAAANSMVANLKERITNNNVDGRSGNGSGRVNLPPPPPTSAAGNRSSTGGGGGGGRGVSAVRHFLKVDLGFGQPQVTTIVDTLGYDNLLAMTNMNVLAIKQLGIKQIPTGKTFSSQAAHFFKKQIPNTTRSEHANREKASIV